MLLFLENNTMVPKKSNKNNKNNTCWKKAIFASWWIFTKIKKYQRGVPIKGGIFFWKKFTYHFFWIFNDLAEFCFKIDILGLENEILGIFGSKNTKKSIFSKMLPEIHRYQNFMEKHFRTSQVPISDHIWSYKVVQKTLWKIDFLPKSRFSWILGKFFIFDFSS